jgi:hypothetical protein
LSPSDGGLIGRRGRRSDHAFNPARTSERSSEDQHNAQDRDRDGTHRHRPAWVPSPVVRDPAGRRRHWSGSRRCDDDAAARAHSSGLCPASVAREDATGRAHPEANPHERRGRADQVPAALAVWERHAAGRRQRLRDADDRARGGRRGRRGCVREPRFRARGAGRAGGPRIMRDWSRSGGVRVPNPTTRVSVRPLERVERRSPEARRRSVASAISIREPRDVASADRAARCRDPTSTAPPGVARFATAHGAADRAPLPPRRVEFGPRARIPPGEPTPPTYAQASDRDPMKRLVICRSTPS